MCVCVSKPLSRVPDTRDGPGGDLIFLIPAKFLHPWQGELFGPVESLDPI